MKARHIGSALVHTQSDKEQVLQNGRVKVDNISYVNSSMFAIALCPTHPSTFSTVPHEFRPNMHAHIYRIHIHTYKYTPTVIAQYLNTRMK
jgi:hypothetical protein